MTPGIAKYHRHYRILQWVDQVVIPQTFAKSKPLGEGAARASAQYIAESNQVLWGIRLRQARVRSPSTALDCAIPQSILNAGLLGQNDCILAYDHDLTKETRGFGGKTLDKKQLYTFTPRAESGWHFEFGPDGYVVDLVPLNETHAYRTSRAMQCNPRKPVDAGPLWHDTLANRSTCVPFVDEQTAALFVVVQVYNPNNNIFFRIQMVTEFDYTGKVGNMVIKNSASFAPQEGAGGPASAVFIILMLWMILEFAYWINEFRLGAVNVTSAWTLIDLTIFVLSGIYIYDAIQIMIGHTANLVASALEDENTYTDLFVYLDWREYVNFFQGFLILLLLIRFFKYLNFISGLRAVFLTIVRAGVDLVYFFILFIAVILAFVFSGYVVFGPEAEDFSSIGQTIATIMRLVVLDFDYDQIEQTAPLGPVYFAVSMFFFYFLLVNIFTAIMLSSWRIEKKRLDEEEEKRRKTREAVAAAQARENDKEVGGGGRSGGAGGGDGKDGAASFSLMGLILYIVTLQWLKHVFRILCNPVRTFQLIKAWADTQRRSMSTREVMLRLEQWKARKHNAKTEFLNFHHIQQALAGGERNRIIVSDWQVQQVMGLCRTKRKGGEKFLHTEAEMHRLMQADDNSAMDDMIGPADDNALESVAGMKKLVQAIGVIHKNQRAFWRDVNATLRGIQEQTLQAQNRLHSITYRVDSMVPHGECRVVWFGSLCSLVTGLVFGIYVCLTCPLDLSMQFCHACTSIHTYTTVGYHGQADAEVK